MTYTTSKGRTRTWGSTTGVTSDTSSSSYTKETTFFSKGFAESGSRSLSDYWWVPTTCVDVTGFRTDPSESNEFCDNVNYTTAFDGNYAIFF